MSAIKRNEIIMRLLLVISIAVTAFLSSIDDSYETTNTADLMDDLSAQFYSTSAELFKLTATLQDLVSPGVPVPSDSVFKEPVAVAAD